MWCYFHSKSRYPYGHQRYITVFLIFDKLQNWFLIYTQFFMKWWFRTGFVQGKLTAEKIITEYKIIIN